MSATNFHYPGSLKDERLVKRYSQIAYGIYAKSSGVIQQFSKGNTEITAARRFFNNKRLDVTTHIAAITQRMQQVVSKRVLLIEDTTEFNYTSKRKRIHSDSLGPITKATNTGFFLHPCLVVDAANYKALGYSSISLWKRDSQAGNKHQRNYTRLPIERKESWRWICSIQKSKEQLPKQTHKIVIADREADIYTVYERIKDEQTDLIIRAKSDRQLKGKESISNFLAHQPVRVRKSMLVRSDPKDNRSKHKAELELKYGYIQIKNPKKDHSQQSGSYFGLYILEVKESTLSVRKGECPIHWILCTTLPITNQQQAETVLEYYTKRWMIEELFGVLKSRGLNLEDSQLTRGDALMKLTIVCMDVALKIIQLTKARQDEQTKADAVFNPLEIKLVKLLVPEYEGNTEKQKNPFKQGSLAWAAWLIGRLGGWTGYQKAAPPGNKTMARGLERFNSMFIAFNLLH
jgi:transposase